MVSLDLTGGQVLGPEGLRAADVYLSDGRIVDASDGRKIDLSGFLVLPGIVDIHGDGFERHLAPRRGAMKQMAEGLIAAEAEFAANGITTAVLAQFVSWEGGLRGPEFAENVFDAIRQTAPTLVTDLKAQLRFETHLLDLHAQLPQQIADWGVDYVVFNDHLPHDRLSQGRQPPRMVGQALKAGRNPDQHFAMMLGLHARSAEVPPALDRLCAELRAMGVRMGSHDESRPIDREVWHARGVDISEFPETIEAAEAARYNGEAVILGAPNVVRGGSHKGNASAVELISMGLCDALASDYHYPSPRRAALMLAKSGIGDFASCWRLISQGPADILGLSDRGDLSPGKRADIVILEEKSYRVAATLAAGQFSYMSGEIANRFM